MNSVKMSSIQNTSIVFLPSLDSKEKEEVWNTITSFFTHESLEHSPTLINIGQSDWEKLGSVNSITYQILCILRKLQLLPHEHTILLPLHDQYQTIQLCLARMNKEKYGEFTASASDVLDVWKHIHDSVIHSTQTDVQSDDNDVESDSSVNGSDKPDTSDVMMRHMLEAVNSYKKFLETSQCIDHSQLYSILKKNINSHGQLRSEINEKVFIVENVNNLHESEIIFLELLSKEGVIYEVMDGAEPKIKSVSLKFSEYKSSLPVRTPTKSSEDEVKGSEEYLVQLVLAHLRLVINPHDELALVLACSMPGRDISQQDFMHINTMSKKKNMPKFQAIITYIKRLRALQPEPDCPIRKLSQPLANFVDEIEKLHGIASCEPDTKSGTTRILDTIKKSLITMVMKRGSILHQSTIEKVCESLKQSLFNILNIYSHTVAKGNTNTSSENIDFENNGPLEPCLQLLVHLCDFSSGLITCRGVVDAIGDNFLTHTLTSPQKATISMRIPTVVPDHVDDNDFEKDFDIGGESLLDRILKKKGTPLGTPSTPQTKSINSSLNSSLNGSIFGASPLNISNSPDASFSPHMESTLRSLAAGRKRTSDTTNSWKKTVANISNDEEQAKKEEAAELERLQNKNKKGEKRKKTSEEGKENEQKNKNAKDEAEKEKPVPKQKPLAKGQTTLMAFFKPK
ncbi:unnamed protein product [Meganyctiphanes norvegica]|uniref:PCNA-interacting partner n=1 Tax=Meganyctiphanes norvegica TaxID=48144 RepID=A0AAV2RI19_MEGNR